MKRIKWNNGTETKVWNLFGLTIALGWFGNCVVPCIHIQPYSLKGHWACSFTWRDSRHIETTVYYNNFRLWWNSEHVARKFGDGRDCDHGYCYFYKGWLGEHCDV